MPKIKLNNVRLSFPSIFAPSVFEGKSGKYEATLLLPKDRTAIVTKIESAIEEAVAKSRLKIPRGKWCFKDGDDSEYDGYEDNWSLKAANSKRPTVIDRSRAPVTAEDEIFYAGCQVNAIIDFWIQNNSYGNRVNANLYGLQFVADNTPFGLGPIDVTDDFDELDDDDDDL